MLDSNVTYSEYRLTVVGNVHLILTDGCKLNAEHGIRMAAGGQAGAKLTVYAQSTGKRMGEITANAAKEDYCSGIGGNKKEPGGNVVINGGKITGRKAGTTCIYAYAQDGVCKRIRVTVN